MDTTLLVGLALACIVALVGGIAHALDKRPLRRPAPDFPPTVRCPCCGYRTLTETDAYEICPVCFWEDDRQGDEEADEVWGGPNGDLSLTQARLNFREFGASSRKRLEHVRPPTIGEI